MKGIILAGGSSLRLGDITADLPKGLLEINGKSIIQRQIETYKKNGINEIIIITGPNSKKFNFQNVTYVQDENYEKHEVLGSLMTAKEFMTGGFIMTYSDIIYDESVLASILNSNNPITIAVDLECEEKYDNRTEHPKSEADNVLIENKKILNIKKNIIKEKNTQKIGEFIGMMKISENGFRKFANIFSELNELHTGKFQNAPTFKKAYLTDILQELIDRGIEISAEIIKGKWIEIDTPQDLKNAIKDF